MANETNDIKQFRLSIDFTLADLAALLRIPISVLSMAESNMRLLPTAADLQLEALQQLLQEALPNLPTADTSYPKQKAQLALHSYLAECNQQLVPLQEQLQLMQHKYQRATNKLKIITALRLEAMAINQGWVNAQQADALEKLKAYGPEAQEPLLVKIAVLTYAVDLVEDKVMEL